MSSIKDIMKEIKKIPKRSVNFFLFCLSGVLIFVFGGLVPAYWNSVQLNQKINDARRRIADNETLLPIFRSMQSARGSAPGTLTIPPRVALPRTEIERVGASFREIAGRFGMKVVSVVPDLAATGDPHALVVNVSLRGDFENFRNVLKTVGELPYVEQIKEFAIQRAGNSRVLDIQMHILLAVN